MPIKMLNYNGEASVEAPDIPAHVTDNQSIYVLLMLCKIVRVLQLLKLLLVLRIMLVKQLLKILVKNAIL
jgi:hypothetical protein